MTNSSLKLKILSMNLLDTLFLKLDFIAIFSLKIFNFFIILEKTYIISEGEELSLTVYLLNNSFMIS